MEVNWLLRNILLRKKWIDGNYAFPCPDFPGFDIPRIYGYKHYGQGTFKAPMRKSSLSSRNADLGSIL
jgi:hypothetical protein